MKQQSRHAFSSRRLTFVGCAVAFLVSSGFGPRPENDERETASSLEAVTVKAVDHAWDEQSQEGHGANWVKCNWPPFESDDHYGVTLMAIAVGMAEGSYRQTDRAEAGTGFVVFALRESGVPASDPRIQKGVAWLLTYQRANGYWWTQSLRNEPDMSNFLTHAGTTFALKALAAMGLPES